MNKPAETFHFDLPLNSENEGMLGFTLPGTYNSTSDTTERYNKVKSCKQEEGPFIRGKKVFLDANEQNSSFIRDEDLKDIILAANVSVGWNHKEFIMKTIWNT